MPPAIEEEEGLVYESASDNTASPQQLAVQDAVMIDISDGSRKPSQQPEREPSPIPVVSDIPLVVSDIPHVTPDLNGVTAPPPQLQTQSSKLIEKGAQKPSKRKASPKWPMAKRRRGQERDFPCTYCVRRMANDPSWGCHEAAVNQFGEPYYTGTRCSECVGAHVSCLSVPPQGIEPVTNLMTAAQEVARNKNSDGTQNIALLAAYEAAIRPALRAIAGVTIPPSEKGKRGPKKKADKRPGQGAGSTKPPSKQTIGTNNVPGSRHENERLATEHRGYLQQPTGPDPASSVALPQANYAPPPHPHVHDPATFERMERQALRRRKVESLESLAHTAALFLAEFMDFRKGHAAAMASSSSTSNGTGAPPPPGPGAGSAYAYAAAAAGMAANLFQPPAGVNNWDGQRDAGDERPGRLSDSESLASDSDDDDRDIPARVAQGNAGEEEYDSETTSEDSVDYNLGPEADEEGPDVKLEDD